MSTASDHRKLDGAAAGGLAWSAGAKSATQLLTWLSTLIAARLLTRGDFGLVNMAGLFGNLTVMLAEFGLGTAVLQMPELDSEVIGQVNTASVAICTAAYFVAVLVAPLVAAFFKAEQVRMLVIVNSLGLIIMGFQSVPTAILEKELDYRKVSIAEALQSCVTAIMTIVLAVSGFAYWSLVIGPLSGRVLQSFLVSWWARPKFRMPRWKQVEAPIRLGVHVAVGRLASAVYLLSDGVIVGRFLGKDALGTYQLAMTLASAPADKIGLLIMRVTGPLFARVQSDLGLVRRYFKIVSEGLSLTILPLLAGLVIVAPECVDVVLGPKWAPAVGPLRWLAVFAGLRTLNTLVSQVLTSLRHTRFTMWMSIFGFVIMPCALIVASRWGTTAVAASWILLAPITILPLVVRALAVMHLRFAEALNSVMPALGGSAAMIAALLAWRWWGGGMQLSPIFKLAGEIVAGGAIYGGVLLGFYRGRIFRYVDFVRGLRKGKTGLVATET